MVPLFLVKAKCIVYPRRVPGSGGAPNLEFYATGVEPAPVDTSIDTRGL